MAAAHREARLLRHLDGLTLPFRVPEPVAEIPLEAGVAVVQHLVAGMPLDRPAVRDKRCAYTARVASACHALPPDPLEGHGHPTRRAHAERAIEIFDGEHAAPFTDARAWALDHLPADTPGRLLHGDLLGHNLHLDPFEDSLGVIDWTEAQQGDPAYDLAIVTRGVKRPFGKADGLASLLRAYNEHAVDVVTKSEVHLHELCLLTKLYQVGREHGASQPDLDQRLSHVRSVLQRARQQSSGRARG